ncbi:MAG TPA: biotin--[acetyl-CoA-carboxylase] ligase [Nocardioides sp.]|jgi:BirA family biotin operon repressor/biotin-[acetyl-CoA-carboxylase] ligase|uniref:biotin--[acetyl-CoA-carboxylase] ligase n=1 Tax=Nocardioides sp. TaxID=35761 RepID=UPI002E3191E7|nr:biotin--[acetyl-CoA-carboxylase] ligase [Nocardioides sp.]HEX3932586.1 biotin--[acetyl-CoA-carboxylase] ligase [Nocardioides sp.]
MNAGSPRAALDERALREAAGPPWEVRLLAEAGSTNQVAAADPVRDRIVVAEHQQAGRGRLDRVWVTPRGAALTFSAVVDPAVDTAWWTLVPLVAGYAVASAVGDATLKWPNDVLIGEQKVAGILVERVGTKPPLLVIGIGINVDQTTEELPVPTATSLALEGRAVDRTELFGRVVRRLAACLGELARSPRTFVDQYRAHSATLGRDVRVELPGDRAVTGRVCDFDEHGRLLLQTAEGLLALSAGDVVHVRPAG